MVNSGHHSKHNEQLQKGVGQVVDCRTCRQVVDKRCNIMAQKRNLNSSLGQEQQKKYHHYWQSAVTFTKLDNILLTLSEARLRDGGGLTAGWQMLNL